MLSDTILTSGAPAVIVENGAGKHVPSYRVEVDLDQMTWGDNMIQVEFQLLMEIAEDAENATRTQRIEAYRQLKEGFHELTAFLDRVATVYRDGMPVASIANVPMHFVKEIMAAIADAKGRQGTPKN